MAIERDYPSAESLRLDENEDRIEELVDIFENGIDSVLDGERKSAVLFEGDFVQPVRLIHKIDIGKGRSTDTSIFFTKFIGAIIQRGSIVSAKSESCWEELPKGKTDALKYFRAKFSGSRFPVDRTTYLVETDEGPDLMIYSQRFNTKDSKRTPIIWRWIAEDNQLLNLIDSPTKGKEKVLIPA